MFELNPQAPDGLVSADEFVAALHCAAAGGSVAGELGPLREADLARQLEATRIGHEVSLDLARQLEATRPKYRQIAARVQQHLQRSVLSHAERPPPQPRRTAAADAADAPCVAVADKGLGFVTDDGAHLGREAAGLTQDGACVHAAQAAQAALLRHARAAFRRVGFQNVAELFVFVEGMARGGAGPVAAEAGGTGREVSGQQLVAALTALNLHRDVAGTDLLAAMGKASPDCTIPYNTLVRIHPSAHKRKPKPGSTQLGPRSSRRAHLMPTAGCGETPHAQGWLRALSPCASTGIGFRLVQMGAQSRPMFN